MVPREPLGRLEPETATPEQRIDLPLTIRHETESRDGWFDYVSLFEDGLLTIDVHFGWDYHNDYHITHARTLFSWLQGRGFEAPVETFEELNRASGPFRRTIEAGGRTIEVQVRIFYGQTGTDTDPDTDAGGRVLEEDMRSSLANQDVIIYSGHSGPFYGFALANWRRTEEGDLDDSEMASVEMPFERYQIVVAEGCDTYHIGESFRQNPAKPEGRFLDIITTTAPSSANSPATVQDTIDELLGGRYNDEHDPQPILALLRDLDSNSMWRHTMYGVHGIDDNPHAHPWANFGSLCASCEEDADCGGPGNRCVEVGQSGRRCVVSCTADDGCPEGYGCREVASYSGGVIFDSVCSPANSVCP